MGRSVSVVRTIIFLVLTAALVGCGSSSTTNSVFPVPARILLAPGDIQSLELGSTLTFTATPQTNTATSINEPVVYQSSNPAVVTIATNGVACAGSWNSLTVPQVCTPGPVGSAQITATTKGVSSPPTTVYVHQHIDRIVASPLPMIPPPPPTPCISKGLTSDYQANAFNGSTDITATVGTFTWTAQSGTVVTLNTATQSNPITGLLPGQVQATANTPGITSIFASASGVASLPINFTTCPVQSIALTVDGSSINPIIVAKGGSKTVVATVLDSLGATISGSFLSWSSSDPAIAAVASGSVTTSQAGGASIIASCTPPTCNIGFLPTLPIYPESAVDLIVTPTTTTQTVTVYVSSTGCKHAGIEIDGCFSATIPLTTAASATSPGTTVGTPINLPAIPNSLVFDRQGKKAYLGTDVGDLGTKGLMVLNAAANPATVSQFPSVTGKVLSVSPDGNTVIVSDTLATPNQVYVFNSSNNSSVALNITGATAADFSPDNLKAYILAGGTLYVYSALEALKTIPLAAPANDVSFHPTGAFAYLAGGAPSAVTVRKTCDNTIANDSSTPPKPQIVPLSATPAFIKPLPDSTQVLAVNSTDINIIQVATKPIGCAPPSPALPAGLPTVSDGPVSSFPLGAGDFVPTQLIVAADGSKAYVLSSSVANVIIFDIGNQTSSPIALNGGAAAIHSTLSPDGNLLYVAANDGAVHIVDLVAGGDIDQITFPQGTSSQPTGLCSGVTFPLQTVINITAATQSGSSTTYSYTLTSGPPLQAGLNIAITGMANAGNNGNFTISSVVNGMFTVVNPSGITAGGQNGTGTITLNCNPDLIAVKP
jgi:trimeric autotransporter adhesin